MGLEPYRVPYVLPPSGFQPSPSRSRKHLKPINELWYPFYIMSIISASPVQHETSEHVVDKVLRRVEVAKVAHPSIFQESYCPLTS